MFDWRIYLKRLSSLSQHSDERNGTTGLKVQGTDLATDGDQTTGLEIMHMINDDADQLHKAKV